VSCSNFRNDDLLLRDRQAPPEVQVPGVSVVEAFPVVEHGLDPGAGVVNIESCDDDIGLVGARRCVVVPRGGLEERSLLRLGRCWKW
jgi:hypothetical protein